MNAEEIKSRLGVLKEEYKASKSDEEAQKVCREWLRLGKEAEFRDAKTVFAGETAQMFIRTQDQVAYDDFKNAVSGLNFEDKISLVSMFNGDSKFSNWSKGVLNDAKLPAEGISRSGLEQVNSVVANFRAEDVKGFFYEIKNLNLSYENRTKVNSCLSGAHLRELNPQFHDLDTIKRMFEQLSNKEEKMTDDKPLKKVLEHCVEDGQNSQYYSLLGNNIGKIPETRTARLDNIMEHISGKIDKNVVAEVRKHFVMKDILSGKSDMLEESTIASVLNEGDKITLLNKLSVEKLSDIYYGKNFDFNSHQKLLAVSKLLKVSGKDEAYYLNLMEDGKHALGNAPHSREAELFTDAAKGFADEYGASRLVAEAKNKINQKNSLDQDLRGIDKKRYAYEQGIDTLTKVQDIWSKIQENTAEGQEGISKAEVLQVIAKAVENGENVDGSLKLAVPKTKLPLLFGRKEAEKKQKDLESAVEALNKTLSNPKAMQNLKDLGVENALDKMVLNRLDNHVKAGKLKREQLVESYRGIGDLISETFVVNKAKQFANTKNDIEETKGKGEEDFATKVEKLRGVPTNNVEHAAEDRGKKRSERAQPPKTAEEKKQAALAAYARRKEAIGKR